MENQNGHVEHLVLGPLDPIDDDLNQARDVLDQLLPGELNPHFLIGYIRRTLDHAAEGDPELNIRRARAMFVAYDEAVAS
jgi:hypothetical protein